MNAGIRARTAVYFCTTVVLSANVLRAGQKLPAPRPSATECRGTGPYPCARTDLKVQQESTPAGWSWNPPANTVQNDPDFGSPILRVTDNSTLTSPSCFNRPSSYNSSMHGPSSPEVNVFSSDDEWIRVSDEHGMDWLMSLDPTALRVGCAKVASNTGGQLPLFHGLFGRSKADAGEYYGIESQHIIAKYDVTQHANPANMPVAVMDLGQCPGLSFLGSLPNHATEWSPTLSLSGDDRRIMYTVGPVQDEGWLSVLYDQETQKCGWVDLRTGHMGGDLWAGGQIGGAFPLNFNENGGPPVPVISAAASSGGRLIPGHAYKIQYSLVYESNMSGTGETAGSFVQSIKVGGSQNAITLPSPAASTNDSVVWTHYNVYACDQTAKPGCTPTLQPASNLGCTLSAPLLTATTVGGSGSTTYNYIEEAVGPKCNTWGSVSVKNGPNSLTGKNYVKVTMSAVSGANRYRLITGSWTHGTTTVDHGYLPGEIYESGVPGSQDENGSQLIALSAVGTIPAGTSSALKSITGGGPPAPTVSTLGIFLHAQLMSLDGNWVAWSQEAVTGSSLYWNLGTTTSQMCNVVEADEDPPSSYVSCVGHGVMGYQGPIASEGEPGAVDSSFDENWRPFVDMHSLDVPAGSVVRMIRTFPARDTVCAAGFDKHQSWNMNQGAGDLLSPFLVTEDAAGTASCQSPSYIGRAWEREIVIVDPSTGIVYRVAHHRTSATSHYLASCSVSPHCESDFFHISLADASTSGRFAMFTSDMEWHLGCDPVSGGACTYNSSGQVISGEARADVWIVGLNPATAEEAGTKLNAQRH